MLLSFPVLHHVVDGFHPVKDKDENQEHTVEEGSQKVYSAVTEIEMAVMLSVCALKIHTVVLLFLLTLIPDINSSGRKCKCDNQNAKIEKVSKHMHILV